jgi:hypothetical protein
MSEERYKAQMLYYVNMGRLTYIATCIQCGLDTLLNLPFKSIFFLGGGGACGRTNCDGKGHPANVAACARMTLCPISFKIHFNIHLLYNGASIMLSF